MGFSEGIMLAKSYPPTTDTQSGQAKRSQQSTRILECAVRCGLQRDMFSTLIQREERSNHGDANPRPHIARQKPPVDIQGLNNGNNFTPDSPVPSDTTENLEDRPVQCVGAAACTLRDAAKEPLAQAEKEANLGAAQPGVLARFYNWVLKASLSSGKTVEYTRQLIGAPDEAPSQSRSQKATKAPCFQSLARRRNFTKPEDQPKPENDSEVSSSLSSNDAGSARAVAPNDEENPQSKAMGVVTPKLPPSKVRLAILASKFFQFVQDRCLDCLNEEGRFRHTFITRVLGIPEAIKQAKFKADVEDRIARIERKLSEEFFAQYTIHLEEKATAAQKDEKINQILGAAKQKLKESIEDAEQKLKESLERAERNFEMTL
ncbi:MAG TPA: hypothetical protein VLE96_05145 [Chlamydiales bacterium]|nr:hypothetical protein [Chlamydiales bacterium]